MVRGSIQMLEVRWHKADHFACSWFGFAHRGGVSIIFLFLFCVFCTHGLRVNHFPLSDVSFAHKGGVPKSLHTWAVLFNVFLHLPNIQHARICFQSIFLYMFVCGWTYQCKHILITCCTAECISLAYTYDVCTICIVHVYGDTSMYL